MLENQLLNGYVDFKLKIMEKVDDIISRRPDMGVVLSLFDGMSCGQIAHIFETLGQVTTND
jgi:hypothetical protein